MRLLIVDDAEAPLKCLHRMIADMGHEVVGVARNGEEAVSRFRELHPDAVVMDMIMPRMNGLEALQAIRALDPEARVVMGCSLKSCEVAFASEKSGARYFLQKPYEEEAVRRIVTRLAGEVSPANGNGRPPATATPPDAPALRTRP
jgi:two-component system chemotaxis response regulator CheY